LKNIFRYINLKKYIKIFAQENNIMIKIKNRYKTKIDLKN